MLPNDRKPTHIDPDRYDVTAPSPTPVKLVIEQCPRHLLHTTCVCLIWCEVSKVLARTEGGVVWVGRIRDGCIEAVGKDASDPGSFRVVVKIFWHTTACLTTPAARSSATPPAA